MFPFKDRRDAKKYASQVLKAGYIKHAIKKSKFSEQCYYTFCDEKLLSESMLFEYLKKIICSQIGTNFYFSDLNKLEINLEVEGNNSPMHQRGAVHLKQVGVPLLSGGSGGPNPIQGLKSFLPQRFLRSSGF